MAEMYFDSLLVGASALDEEKFGGNKAVYNTTLLTWNMENQQTTYGCWFSCNKISSVGHCQILHSQAYWDSRWLSLTIAADTCERCCTINWSAFSLESKPKYDVFLFPFGSVIVAIDLETILRCQPSPRGTFWQVILVKEVMVRLQSNISTSGTDAIAIL
ncbi:hypothetical protein [Microseira sp. BLCC-F43]|jgi:hypothetical protein|uniref:hypothetical protein n=1 Tax=Microseira sp. BLCC-F43 TaxID=3153602 RepID=UPI0035B70EC4